MDKQQTLKIFDELWQKWYVQGLSDFISVSNLTPEVDPEFHTNGLIEKAIELVDKYVNELEIKGLKRHMIKLKDAPPMVIYEIESELENAKNIMMYGHLDKQPYGEGWDADKKPNQPTIIDNRLYGRGGADDGYSVFSAMLAIKNIQLQNQKHGRIVMVLETEEESGSPNLLNLLDEAKSIIKVPDLCLCLDSGAMDYDHLWLTSSLRGVINLDFDIACGKQGFHSGEVGGIVPETFRILRQLLDRLDDSVTGKVVDEFQSPIPQYKLEEAKQIAQLAGTSLYTKYKLHDNANCCVRDGNLEQLYLDGIWNANLSCIGIHGIPHTEKGGNVVRSNTGMRLSMRLPPNYDSKKAVDILKQKLTTDVPYNAKVEILAANSGSGWLMKELTPEMNQSITNAAQMFFEQPSKSYGMGGSIPFLAELQEIYPTTQIIALGLIGPNANAHGPNEMIDLSYAKKLTMSLSHIVQEYN